MRFTNVLVLLPVLAVLSFSQETNFPVGPQYLITNGSPITLRPIATPSLSLSVQPFTANVTATDVTGETVPTASAPSGTFLGSVYWGKHDDSQIVGRRLQTPSMTASETAAYMNSVASQTTAPQAPLAAETTEAPVGSSVVELTGGAIPSNLPASILDAGVTGTTSAQSLATRGYGIPLGDVAAYWKSHKQAPRVYTNADTRRVHKD